MKKFTRIPTNDCYAVFEENGKFKIGLYIDIKHIPYHVLDMEFDSRELAEGVCKILSEEAEELYREGQASCY